MPIYEYRCEACGHLHEELQKISDPHLSNCPACSEAALKRLISKPSFRLKGAGWYETDFKSDKERKRNLVESGGDGGKADGAAGDGAKADAKPADKPAAAEKSGAGDKAAAGSQSSSGEKSAAAGKSGEKSSGAGGKGAGAKGSGSSEAA